MMSTDGWILVLRPCVINGVRHEPGERIQVDADSARRLIRDRCAVPNAGPGRMMVSDTSGTAPAGAQ